MSKPLINDEDYEVPEDSVVWLTVGNGSLRIEHGSEGLRVQLFPLHAEMDDEIDELSASWLEIRRRLTPAL